MSTSPTAPTPDAPAAHLRRLTVLVGAIVLVDTMFFAALTPLLHHYTEELDLGKAGAGALQSIGPSETVRVRDGVIRLTLTLPRQGVSLLALTY